MGESKNKWWVFEILRKYYWLKMEYDGVERIRLILYHICEVPWANNQEIIFFSIRVKYDYIKFE